MNMKIKVRLSLIVIAHFIVLVSCHKTPTENELTSAYSWAVSTPEAQGLDGQQISAAVEEAREKAFILSLLVVRNGYLVSENYYYPELHNKNTPWVVRSVTKSFVSSLIGIAIEEGYIGSVEEKVLDYYPEYVTEDLDPRKRDITIEDLLTMKSGFPSDRNADALLTGQDDFIKDILELPLMSDPGEEFHYSSAGAHLLSGIITKATGMNTKTFAEKYLCAPLGISIPYWEGDAQNYPYGGSGMDLIPRDMARFGYLFLKTGIVDGNRIVPEAWVSSSLQYHFNGESAWDFIEEIGYGYLWWIGKLHEYRVYFALGWAGQYIIFVPDLDMVIVTTCGYPLSSEEADEQEKSVLKLVYNYILPSVQNE